MTNPALVAPGRSTAPFHVVPGGAPRSRRLLLLSYHFPPGMAVGALRWEKFSLVGAARGWELDVVTAAPPMLGKTDSSRLNGLPPGTRVFGAFPTRTAFGRIDETLAAAYRRLQRGPSAGRTAAAANGGLVLSSQGPQLIPRAHLDWGLQSLKGWKALYGALRHHDRERRWELGAEMVGREVLDTDRHEAIITAGPPHAVHNAGHRLAAHSGLPHLVDLRDPWSLTPSLLADVASPLMGFLERRDERRVFEAARLVVSNTPRLGSAIAQAYPRLAEKVITVMNGFDDDRILIGRPREKFTVAFAGNIYIDRSPLELFRAAGALVRRRNLSASAFEMAFMGHVHDFGGSSLQLLAEREGIGQHLRLRPHGTRAEAHRFLSEASVLVNLPQATELSLPSKVFEYMLFDAWLLILARAGTATADVFAGRDADLVDPHDVSGIERALETRYDQFAHGERATPLRLTAPELSREAQGAKLFDALERVTGP